MRLTQTRVWKNDKATDVHIQEPELSFSQENIFIKKSSLQALADISGR